MTDNQNRAIILAKSWRQLLLLLALIPLVIEFFVTAQRAKEQPPLPGWKTIRPPHDASALVLQDKLLWVGGKDGVVAIDTINGEVVATLECDRPLKYVRALVLDSSETLWIGHGAGLSYHKGSECHSYEEKFFNEQINSLYLDRQGQIWVGTWHGAAVREKKGWRELTVADGLPDKMVNIIYQDRFGGMWFGSATAPRGGLSHCNKKQCQKFSTDNGLPHNSIIALIEDKAGYLWVGTGFFDRGGAVRMKTTPSGWVIEQVLKAEDGLAGAKVRSIYQDRDGVLWFGSEYDGLARLEREQWLTLTEKDGLANGEVKAMVQDKAGNLWIATRDGVTRISADQLRDLRR